MLNSQAYKHSLSDTAEVCVVLGVNGQDGSYVAEHLISEGKTVIGIGRQKRSRWLKKQKNYSYISQDLSEILVLVKLLHQLKPSLVFNAAAVHGANSFDYEQVWQQAHLINTGLTNGILEYISKYNQNCSYFYLGSSKSFGSQLPKIIDEQTPKKGTCIYSITKNAAGDLINYYRSKYGINAKVAWTFNHESPRRQKEYFVPKVVNILAQALQEKSYRDEIYTLNFWCDWGDANEYMKICTKLALSNERCDFVLATGKTLWAETFVEDLFMSFKLDYRDHIELISSDIYKPDYWKVDTSLLSETFNMTPEKDIFEVCDNILTQNYGIRGNLSED